MEELIYWGIIFLFYLFSAYRSRQKKVETEEFQVVEPSPQTENRNSRTDFNNIFEFLDEAMEKSALNLDDDLASNINQQSNDDLLTQHQPKQLNQSIINEEPDLNIVASHCLLNGIKISLFPSITVGMIMFISTGLWYLFINRHNLFVV